MIYCKYHMLPRPIIFVNNIMVGAKVLSFLLPCVPNVYIRDYNNCNFNHRINEGLTITISSNT